MLIDSLLASPLCTCDNCRQWELSPDDLLCVRCAELLDNMALCFHCSDCCACWDCPSCGKLIDDDPNNSPSYQGCARCSRCADCGCRCEASIPDPPHDALLRAAGRRGRQIAPPAVGSSLRQQLKEAMLEFRKRTTQATLHSDEEGVTMENEVGVVFWASSKKEFHRNPLRRMLSLEIEIAQLGEEWSYCQPSQVAIRTLAINEVAAKWGAQLVEDISLPAGGFEINTAPANGDKFLCQLEEIYGILARFGASCTNTRDRDKRVEPCGLHVHVDARDMKYNDLRRFLLLYAFVEPTLFAMLPGYRRSSHYSVPCGAKYAQAVLDGRPLAPKDRKKFILKTGVSPEKYPLLRLVYQANLPKRHDKRACPQETRYRALNLHQWFYRGTLEFRHMYGTMDVEDASHWAMLMGSLVDWSQKTSEKKIYELTRPSRSPIALLTDHIACTKGVGEFVEAQLEKFKGSLEEGESPLLRNVMPRQEARGAVATASGNMRLRGFIYENLSRPEPPAPQQFTWTATPASSFGLNSGDSSTLSASLVREMQREQLLMNEPPEIVDALASGEEETN